jgi:hypothetical protein
VVSLRYERRIRFCLVLWCQGYACHQLFGIVVHNPHIDLFDILLLYLYGGTLWQGGTFKGIGENQLRSALAAVRDTVTVTNILEEENYNDCPACDGPFASPGVSHDGLMKVKSRLPRSTANHATEEGRTVSHNTFGALYAHCMTSHAGN